MINRRALPWVLLIFALTVAAYAPGLRSPFQFDDEAGILLNPAVWRLSDPIAVLTYKSDLPRPIFNLSLALDCALWWGKPLGFHISSLVVHFLCTLLVWRLTFDVLRIFREEFSARVAGIVAGLTFAIHPAGSEAVIYIWSRSSSLMTLFVLASAISWLAGIKSLRRGYIFLSFIFYLLAIGSKEEAVFFPALLAAMDLCLFDARGRRKRLIYTLPFWLVPLALFGIRWIVASAGLDFVSWRAGLGDDMAHLAHKRGLVTLIPYNFATQCKVALKYLSLLFWPLGLSVDHGVVFEDGMPSIAAMVGILAVFGSVAFFFLFRQRFRVAAVAVSFFLLPLMVFYFVPISDAMVERRLYLPLVGFSLAVGAYFAWAIRYRSRIATITAVALIASLGTLTHLRAKVWQNKISLWTDAVQTSPEKLRPRMILARYLFEANQLDRAINQNLMVWRIKRTDSTPIVNLGLIYYRKGDLDTAQKYFSEAVQLHPRADFNAHFNLGVVYERQGKLAEAVEHFKISLDINPGMATSHHKLGRVAALQGDHDLAISHFRAALDINSDLLEARMNLGNALIDAGKRDEGLIELEKAAKIAPKNILVIFNLGMAYLETGRFRKAQNALEAAAQANFTMAYFGLAMLKKATGDKREMCSYLSRFLKTAKSPSDPALLQVLEDARKMLREECL